MERYVVYRPLDTAGVLKKARDEGPIEAVSSSIHSRMSAETAEIFEGLF